MTTAHKNLTGTDLHEVKGASTATAGQVPTADGLGGAPFSSGGGQLIHVREEQPNGVQSTSSLTLSTFVQTALNTVKTNEISGASLGSNRVTLPAGTYFIEITVPVYIVLNGANYAARAQLMNITTSSIILYGQTVRGLAATGGSGGVSFLIVQGRITLTGVTTLEIQHYKSQGQIGAIWGGGGTEVYSEMLIWKVA